MDNIIKNLYIFTFLVSVLRTVSSHPAFSSWKIYDIIKKCVSWNLLIYQGQLLMHSTNL